MLLAIVLIVVLLALRPIVKRCVRAWLARDEGRRDGRVCRCGYDLTKLELARCPECGRVTGFDSTPEALGLTNDELERISEARRRREQAVAPARATPDLPG